MIAEDLEDVLAKMGEVMVDADQELVEADPAQSRSILTAAIDGGAMMYPPLVTDSWPGCRPLVEWLVRSMPTGGEVPERRNWTDDEQARIQEDFFASSVRSEARPRLTSADAWRSIVWFGTDWGTWRPVPMEPGQRGDAARGLDPSQDRRGAVFPGQGPEPASGLHPLLPRPALHPRSADRRRLSPRSTSGSRCSNARSGPAGSKALRRCWPVCSNRASSIPDEDFSIEEYMLDRLDPWLARWSLDAAQPLRRAAPRRALRVGRGARRHPRPGPRRARALRRLRRRTARTSSTGPRCVGCSAAPPSQTRRSSVARASRSGRQQPSRGWSLVRTSPSGCTAGLCRCRSCSPGSVCTGVHLPARGSVPPRRSG